MKLFPAVIFIVIFMISIPLSAEKRILVYQEKTKAQVTIHRFDIQPQGEGFMVKLFTREDQNTIEQTFTVNNKMETLAWTYGEPSKKTAINARLDEKFIFLSGTYKGEPIEKMFKTKGLPWNQLFNKGVEPFVRSGRKKYKFRAVGTRGPGEMKITSFTVKRVKKPEVIKIMGKGVSVVHIKISLSGLLAMFWTGHYWFRRSDGVFIRYRGKNGPGKPESIMDLIEENTAAR
jgi:hypothetical protein